MNAVDPEIKLKKENSNECIDEYFHSNHEYVFNFGYEWEIYSKQFVLGVVNENKAINNEK